MKANALLGMGLLLCAVVFFAEWFAEVVFHVWLIEQVRNPIIREPLMVLFVIGGLYIIAITIRRLIHTIRVDYRLMRRRWSK